MYSTHPLLYPVTIYITIKQYSVDIRSFHFNSNLQMWLRLVQGHPDSNMKALSVAVQPKLRQGSGLVIVKCIYHGVSLALPLYDHVIIFLVVCSVLHVECAVKRED